MLCESWTTEYSKIDITDYECIATHRISTKGAKRASGGIVVYIKTAVLCGIEILETECSEMIWLKLNKNVFGFQRDVVIGCCYIPPENSSRQVRDDFDMDNAIITDMTQFDVKYNCEFLVCGDFNSRTVLLPDYVLNDNSSHIPLPDDYIADDQSVIRQGWGSTGPLSGFVRRRNGGRQRNQPRAGVKYIYQIQIQIQIHFFPEFQIQIQIHRQKSDQIQIQIQIQLIKYKYKYKCTMRPGQNCRHFTDDIFKFIVLKEDCFIYSNFTENCFQRSNLQ